MLCPRRNQDSHTKVRLVMSRKLQQVDSGDSVVHDEVHGVLNASVYGSRCCEMKDKVHPANVPPQLVVEGGPEVGEDHPHPGSVLLRPLCQHVLQSVGSPGEVKAVQGDDVPVCIL